MRFSKTLLTLTLWTGIILSLSAQAGGRGSMATTALGHMAVTLLSPVALTAAQDFKFNATKLHICSDSSASEAADYVTSMAAIKVSGCSTYSVTISNKNIGVTKNGRSYSISNLSSVSSNENAGSRNIYISATMRINKRKTMINTEMNNPLAVTINYN